MTKVEEELLKILKDCMKVKLIRIATVPISINFLLKGQMRFLNKYFEVVGISSNGEELETMGKREGVKVIGVDMERRINLLKDVKSLFNMYIQFKKEKPTVIHSITPKAGLISMLAGKMARVPIRMHTFTGLIFPTETGFKKKLLIKIDQILCWAATHVYPEGNGVKNDLIHYKVTSKPLKVLANGNVNGVDIHYYSQERISEKIKNKLKIDLGIHENDFVFVFVGRMVGDKGVNELIRAFSRLNKSYPNTHLILVGQYEKELDPITPEAENLINNTKNIHPVGFRINVEDYYAISHVLLHPSYREGFPNSVLQAGAMELPCIVTDINGSNEIIQNNINGLIIPVKDETALLEAMCKILNDVDFYNRLKSNTRKIIIEKFEQSVVWNALLAEYNENIKGLR